MPALLRYRCQHCSGSDASAIEVQFPALLTYGCQQCSGADHHCAGSDAGRAQVLMPSLIRYRWQHCSLEMPAALEYRCRYCSGTGDGTKVQIALQCKCTFRTIYSKYTKLPSMHNYGCKYGTHDQANCVNFLLRLGSPFL